MSGRRDELRRHRKSANNAKNLAAIREADEMRELWGVVGGFLLGAVYGPRLIRALSRSSWGDKLAEIMRRGIPEPAISPFVFDAMDEAVRASRRRAEKAYPRAGRKAVKVS